MRRRTIVLLVAATLLGFPQPARATHCSGDTWADGNSWSDNYWVGYGCDRNGEYTVGIQRINWGLGFRQSGIDGLFGPNTKNDVIAYQALRGLARDGLVGSATWAAYRNELIVDLIDPAGNGIFYRTAGYSRSWYRDNTPAQRWYGRQLCGSAYFAFGTSGPTQPRC